MKKLLILAMIFAVSAAASASMTYTWTEVSSLGFTDENLSLAGYDLKTSGSLLPLVGSSSPKYLDGADMTGQYGYYTGLLDNGNPGNVQYATIGTTVTKIDNTFTLQVYNDNDDLWGYMLYATDGATTVHNANFVWVAGNGTNNVPSPGTALSLDLSTLTGPSIEVGVAIAAGADSDVFHTSFTVPAPGAILLAGLGTSLVGFVRRRSL
jgi:hypothetical protein